MFFLLAHQYYTLKLVHFSNDALLAFTKSSQIRRENWYPGYPAMIKLYWLVVSTPLKKY